MSSRPYPEPLDLKKVKVYPLASRDSLSSIERILVDPDRAAPQCEPEMKKEIEECARKIASARRSGASVMLIYGAHLIKNGALQLVIALLDRGWVTHLATNGAG